MIIRQSKKGSRRRGVTIVEVAFVCVMFFAMLFGIFEYCRFLFVLHITNNAARDAARYAVVKTNGGNMPGDPTTIATPTQMVDLVKFGTINGQTIGPGMAGMQGNIENMSVNIFTVDPAGLSQTPPVVQPLMNGANPVPWNTAGFTQKIAVQISGQYRPIASGLLILPDTINFKVNVMVSSEAN
jgi:Flp pilus assembly protein TadG